ncbi:MAG: phosphatase PAP2 family protein [Cyclobacteriaceae bacterium]
MGYTSKVEKRHGLGKQMMLEKLLELDQNILLWLNGLNSPAVDPMMIFITNKYTWIPLYFLILYQIIKQYGKSSFEVLIVLIIMIVITDQLTSSLMKPLIGRLRPCHDAFLQSIIHSPNGCGGLYSFVSGHSANSFALAVFVTKLLKSKAWNWLFLWASVVAYSRVYLGVHFPGDILFGGVVGMLIGFGASWLQSNFTYKIFRFL